MPIGYDHVLTCRCYYWHSRHILIDLILWQGSLWDKRWTEPLQSASSYQRATPTTLGHPSRIHALPPSRALPHPLLTRTKGRTRPRRSQKPMGMLTSRLRRLRLALHRLGMSRLMQLILPSHLRHCTLEVLQVVTWHARMHSCNTIMTWCSAALSAEHAWDSSADCMQQHTCCHKFALAKADM